ncbi:superoxide dismutase [Grosmannia clavigera kw1407]|uniref:Superoxide dismutase n=1 Tax=Grosmannia clavigera (strain kw1407 / UAMH 11150) TaxID=655863 RepID=F0XD85_GROCL|nr:superoxide dismutase [Grosmannia clavigera kw1407]EFX03553.1 superoxide dismutase [Grosmannia clavigera kw1407]
MPKSRHDVRVGVPHLLSAEGFDLAWSQHMTLMLARLNQLVAGTDYEDRDLKGIVLDSARSPSQAAVFNHASMAHNTDFFFKQLRPSSDGTPAEIPAPLRSAIDDNFGSAETLRREFAATASAMFGPGFIWLVKASHLPQSGRGGDNLRLLTTYLAGSPYPGAHWRRQAVDMNTVGADGVDSSSSSGNVARQWLDKQAAAVSAGGVSSATAFTASSSSTHLPAASSTDRRPPGGIDAIPLLCLSTWEHVWLRDYGLGADGYGGKAAFVDAWWNAIDWDAVAEMANLNRPMLKT